MATITMTPTALSVEQINRSTDIFTDTAGNMGDADGGNQYIPILYANKVLFDFYKSTVWSEVTNTDYSGQFSKMGDTIQIRVAPNTGDPSAYVKGQSLTYNTPAADAKEMVIDKAFYQAFIMEDIDKVQTDVSLMDMYVKDASERMKIYVDKLVQATMATGAHASNAGTAAGVISSSYNLGEDSATGYISVDRTNALDKLVDLSSVLGEQNIDRMNNFVVIPEWYANRLKLSDLKAADFTGDSTGVVRTGLIGSVNGMRVFVNNSIYGSAQDGSETTNNTYAVNAGVKLATSFALQMSKVDTLTAESTFGQKWRTLWVWGNKVVRPEGLATMHCKPA